MTDQPASIIYIFIDGVGFGRKDNSINPFARFDSAFFAPLGSPGSSFRGPGYMIATDAQMGFGGAPQSATGQTALFTGFNGPAIMGRHVNGYPTFSLRPYFIEHSIIKTLKDHGKKATLINSYSDYYLKKVDHPRGLRLMSASSWAQKAATQNFFKLEDYLEGRSLYMDITNWFLRHHKICDIPMQDPKINGRKLARLARNYDLVLFEYFFTDKVGHSGGMGKAKRILSHIDGFLQGVWEEIDPQNQLVVISSDHGNMEDLSIRTHTENKVPTILYGKGADIIAPKINFLYDIPRQLVQLSGIEKEYPKTA